MSEMSPIEGPQQPGETPNELALRMLYEEQQRLRAQVDELKQKGEQGGKEGKEGEQQEGGKKSGGEGGGEQGGDDEEKKSREPRIPARMKMRMWMQDHPRQIFLGSIGVLILLILGIWLLHHLDSYEDTDDAFVDGHTDPISPRISGFVHAIYVENTYRVKKGQLLLELDPRDYVVAKERAYASYEEAESAARAQAPNIPITQINETSNVSTEDYDVMNQQANVIASEARYNAAVADLHQAEANQENDAREEERYRLLVVKEEVSREQYDQRATQERADTAMVASRREQANAQLRGVEQARAQLGQARARQLQARERRPQQVAMQRETLAQRHANSMSAKAQADQAELNLEYTRIYAPEDGIIGDKQVQLNSQVTAGQELFALTQTNDIWVTANFKETQVQKMRKGQTVRIYVDALGESFDGYVEDLPGGTGAVYSLLPPENATGNYVKVVQRLPVRIRFQGGQKDLERLAPGMSVEPKVWLR